MNEIQRYLAEEHVEDFQDGLISRRELLRRVTLILGSSAAAAAFLAACRVPPSAVGGPATATAAAATAAPTAAATTAATAAATAAAASPAPAAVDGIGSTRAAVLAVYAEQDTRVTAGKDQIEPQLKKAGVPYQINVYPGVNHAFHNDTGVRYSPDQSRKAWVDTIEWFRKYLG